jgi:hypothetical protein
MEYTINILFISNYVNGELVKSFIDNLANNKSKDDYIIVYDLQQLNQNSYRLQFFSNKSINTILKDRITRDFSFEYYYWSRIHKFCGYFNDSNDVYIHNIPDTLDKYEQLMPPIFDTLFNIKKELKIV